MDGISAYKNVDRETADPRKLERQIVRQRTKNLTNARDNARSQKEDTQSPMPYTAALAQAFEENRRMWYEFAVQVSDDGNELPKETRAAVLNLAAYVEREINAVAAGTQEIDAGVDNIAEVNRSIIAGLEGKTETQEA